MHHTVGNRANYPLSKPAGGSSMVALPYEVTAQLVILQ